MPCQALFLRPAEAGERLGPPEASFFGQGTIRTLAQVAREEGEGLSGIFSAIEQQAAEQHPGRRFFTRAGKLLLQLAVQLHGLHRVAAATRFVRRSEQHVGGDGGDVF